MSYEKDFERFLSHTNEKKVLLREVKKIIKERKVSSILDIGAGNGLLSIPLSKEVENYLAVEASEKFSQELEKNGLKVKRGEFPFSIDNTFDMVLMSHSHPDEDHEKFIFSAQKLVNPKGCLLVVTYKDKESEWVNLLKEVGEENVELERVGQKELSEYMQSLGRVSIKKATSFIYADTAEELFEALSFVFSDGDVKLKQRFALQKYLLCDILNKRYKKGKKLFFPFQHFFISLVDFSKP